MPFIIRIDIIKAIDAVVIEITPKTLEISVIIGERLFVW